MKKILSSLLAVLLSAQMALAGAVYGTPFNTNIGGTGATTGAVAINNLYTAQNAILPHWRTALAKVQTNTASTKVLCLGDSTMRGFYSNGAATGDQVQGSFCTQLTQILLNNGYNAISQNFFGLGTTAASVDLAVDSRFTIGSWVGATNVLSLGGSSITSSSAATMSFKPTTKLDTCDIYSLKNNAASSRLGTFSYNIDGGADTNVVGNAAAAFAKTTVTAGTVDYHTWNLKWVSNVDAGPFVQGLDCYDSNQKVVDLINIGWDGSRTSQWLTNTSTPWDPMTAVNALQPSLVIIDLGINDWINNVGASTYGTNLQSMITTIQATGITDIILVSPNPSDPAGSGISLVTQQGYVAQMANAATIKNTAYIDEFTRLGSYTAAAALGIVYTPGTFPGDLHLVKSGYGMFANDLAAILLPQAGVNPLWTGVQGAAQPSTNGLDYNITSQNSGTGNQTGGNVVLTPGAGSGTGTQGLLKINGGAVSTGTKFTMSGCSATAATGGAQAGTYTSGTTGTCTVVLTFNGAAGASGATAPTGWACAASDRTTPADLITQTASSTTTATLSGTTVSGDVISFFCMGY